MFLVFSITLVLSDGVCTSDATPFSLYFKSISENVYLWYSFDDLKVLSQGRLTYFLSRSMRDCKILESPVKYLFFIFLWSMEAILCGKNELGREDWAWCSLYVERRFISIMVFILRSLAAMESCESLAGIFKLILGTSLLYCLIIFDGECI